MKAEITIYIDWFLPAYQAGGPVQSIANLVAQEGEGFTFSIICSNRELDGSVLGVEPNRWTVYNPQTRVIYESAGRDGYSRKNEEEVLFINGIFSWKYNLKPILFSKAKRKIVSVRGMLLDGALSKKPLKKKLYLALWKAAGIHNKVEFHASNSAEEEAIRKRFGKEIKVHLAPNFPRLFQRQKTRKRDHELCLVSVALISPMKNILLVLKSLEQVTEKVTYRIYGPVKDEAYWKKCQHKIASLPGNITVSYHGDLHPAKVEEALQTGDVFILPSESENFGHAIYEALTAGKPTITSNNTPWNRLEKARAGINVSIAEELEIREAVRFFAAMDRTEFERWSAGARSYAEAAIDFRQIRRQYRTMFGLSENR